MATVLVASLTGCGSGSTPGASSTGTPTGSPTPTMTQPSTSPTATASASPSPTLPSSLSPLMPLFPFARPTDVVAWQVSYRAGGHEPWHLDAGQTAVAFAQWLGYTDIDKALGTSAARVGVYVAVGHTVEAGTTPSGTAAQVHVVRWGTGPDAPWEVVGTLDTTLTITSPPYGAKVSSPLTAGGRITGVDENIKVQVRTLGSASVVGSYCCLPAGGEATPWSARVPFAAPAGSVLTVAVQTGGHRFSVERFAVTGVVAR